MLTTTKGEKLFSYQTLGGRVLFTLIENDAVTVGMVTANNKGVGRRSLKF